MKRLLYVLFLAAMMLRVSYGYALEVVSCFQYPVGTEGRLQSYEVSQGYNTSYEEGYCSTDPYYGTPQNCEGEWRYGHDGIDINAVTGGNTDCGNPVFASASGEVVYAGFASGWGNLVRIRHNTVDGERYTLYAHLETIVGKDDRDITVGNIVRGGEKIGTIGNGGVSTNCHLHFGVLKEDINGNGYYYGAGVPDSHLDPGHFVDDRIPPEGISVHWCNSISQTADFMGGKGLIETETENMHWYGSDRSLYVIEDWNDGRWGEVAITYDPETNSSDREYVNKHS